jgi:hypothetical protein
LIVNKAAIDPPGRDDAIGVAFYQKAGVNAGMREAIYLKTRANPDLTLKRRNSGNAKLLGGRASLSRINDRKSPWIGTLKGDIC